MIYDNSNTHRTTRVYDVDTKEEFKAVIWIDTDSGEMLVYSPAFMMNVKGDELEVEVLKYRTISPIFGGYFIPCLFHCYGRL